jgi:soluble lytic murein transglycosylase
MQPEYHTTKRWLKRRDFLMLAIGVAISLLVIIAIIGIYRAMQTPLEPQTAKVSSPWIPQTVKRWDSLISEMAERYKIDPTAIAILMTMESGGNPKAESGAGAKGLMQVVPTTAKEIAKKYIKDPVEKYNLYDPRTNIEFGTAYLAFLRDEFGERDQAPTWNYTMELVAAAYNGGPGTAGEFYNGKGMISTETVVYSRDALNMWRERNTKTSPTFDRWKERGGTVLLKAAELAR